jgi:hypothetical protein
LNDVLQRINESLKRSIVGQYRLVTAQIDSRVAAEFGQDVSQHSWWDDRMQISQWQFRHHASLPNLGNLYPPLTAGYLAVAPVLQSATTYLAVNRSTASSPKYKPDCRLFKMSCNDRFMGS